MATVQDINALFERIRRITARTEVTEGSGVEWTTDVPSFGNQTYKLTGIKSLKEIEDDLTTLAIWIWSVKDYIKSALVSRGDDGQEVERFIDGEWDLQVCADIANSAKHSVLSRSRTGQCWTPSV